MKYHRATEQRAMDCMIAIYDGEWTVVTYLLSRMKCGEATLPERL